MMNGGNINYAGAVDDTDRIHTSNFQPIEEAMRDGDLHTNTIDSPEWRPLFPRPPQDPIVPFNE